MNEDKQITQIIAKSAMKYFITSIITALICLLLFSSCVLTKKQKERFLANNCQRKDSISVIRKDSIIRHDSIVYISLPGTIQYLENPCKLLCDSLGNLKPFNVVKSQNNGVKSQIFKIGNSIGFKSDIDSSKIALSWNEHHVINDEFSHTENTVKIPCELDHRNWIDHLCRWVSLIVLVVLVIRYGLSLAFPMLY